MSIGHQVATIDDLIEAARHDLPTATSLLDFHRLAGDAQLARRLEERAFAGLFSEGALPDFFQRLSSEVDERHRRFGDSVYLLEPEVKSGAGGLRDLEHRPVGGARALPHRRRERSAPASACCARGRREEVAAAKRLPVEAPQSSARRGQSAQRSAELRRTGSDRRVPGLPGASRSLARRSARCHGRDGRGVHVGLLPPRAGRPARSRADRGAHHAAAAPAKAAGPGRRRGAAGLQRRAHSCRRRSSTRTPFSAFRLYTAAVDRGAKVLPYARDAVIRATSNPDFCEALRNSREAAQHSCAWSRNPRPSAFRNGSILAELHDVGLLTAMIPEFLPVVGRVHHDVYHVYTVDVHSVAAVDRLRALARGELAEQHLWRRGWRSSSRGPRCCIWRRCSTTSARPSAGAITPSAAQTSAK